MDDDSIIIRLGSGDIYKLNMTGTKVVRRIQAQHPLDQIITILSQKFGSNQKEIKQEVRELINDLLTVNLIEES